MPDTSFPLIRPGHRGRRRGGDDRRGRELAARRRRARVAGDARRAGQGRGDRHDRDRDRADVPADRRVRRRRVLHADVRGPRRPRQHAQGGRCPLPRPRLHPADRALELPCLRREARLSAREAAGAREDTGGCRRGARRLLQEPRRRRQRGSTRLGIGATQGERRAQRLGPVPDRGRQARGRLRGHPCAACGRPQAPHAGADDPLHEGPRRRSRPAGARGGRRR